MLCPYIVVMCYMDCIVLHEIPFSYILYAYSVKEPIGELNLNRALDEDTGVFSSFFSLLSSSSPLGHFSSTGSDTCMTYIIYVYICT